MDVEMNNGRVNLLGPSSAGGSGPVFDPIPGLDAYGHKTSSEVQFQGDMLRGNWEHNELSSGFFSKENLVRIQKAIRRSVYERSQPKGYIIDDQSSDELKMVMRGLFYQYAKNQPDNIQGQIEELNARVVEWCAPNILSAVEHYFHYLKDIDTLPVPLPQPMHLSRAGTRSKPLQPFM